MVHNLVDDDVDAGFTSVEFSRRRGCVGVMKKNTPGAAAIGKAAIGIISARCREVNDTVNQGNAVGVNKADILLAAGI
ncbi:MAG: hypothetical protein V3W14_06785, partial [Candidatus Neomarinimicrobiota bacterium]